MNDYDACLSEYREALAEVRVNSSLMFAELTVYLASSGALLQLYFKPDNAHQGNLPIAIIGLLLSLAFYVLHDRFGDFVHGARRRAEALERRLGFSLYSSSPHSRPVLGVVAVASAINAARLLLLTGFAGWLCVMFSEMVR